MYIFVLMLYLLQSMKNIIFEILVLIYNCIFKIVLKFIKNKEMVKNDKVEKYKSNV